MFSLAPSHSQFSLPIKTFHGLKCAIETPKWSIRQGHGWMNVSPADYGFIHGYTGADGDEIDCYLGPNLESNKIWVVDQNRMDHSGQFDEHKCMLGYDRREDAIADYYAGHTHASTIFRGIHYMSVPIFKRWLKIGNLQQPLT